jgi:hypothetical protein
MRKVRSDSTLGKLPETKQAALFDVLDRLPLENTEDKEGGVGYLARVEGIALGKSALSDWLKHRRLLALGHRLRAYKVQAAAFAGAAKGTTLADDAFEAAFREFALSRIASGELGTAEAAKLSSMLQASQRIALDKQRLDSGNALASRRLSQSEKALTLAERRVALLEENAATAKARIEDALKAGGNGGISAETLQRVEEALKLL